MQALVIAFASWIGGKFADMIQRRLTSARRQWALKEIGAQEAPPLPRDAAPRLGDRFRAWKATRQARKQSRRGEEPTEPPLEL